LHLPTGDLLTPESVEALINRPDKVRHRNEIFATMEKVRNLPDDADVLTVRSVLPPDARDTTKKGALRAFEKWFADFEQYASDLRVAADFTTSR